MDTILYLVIPCYNEEESLTKTSGQLKQKIIALIKAQRIGEKSRILFVNDGSIDRTWEIICQLQRSDSLFGGIRLSCNRGHQNALMAGLLEAKKHADIVISLDADLQDDPEAIDEMITRYEEGADIVYGVRSSRKNDNLFKKVTAGGYYRVLHFLGAGTLQNHADFRLMRKRALEGLEEFREVNLFLRGLIPMIGYPSAIVTYERKSRISGTSKYSLPRMLSLAAEGITSLSIRPIRCITLLGIMVFLLSIAILIYSFARHFTGQTIVGWTTIMASVWGIGGLILLSLGIIGEYIGKIYLESKARPRYFIEEVLLGEGENIRSN